MPNVFTQPCTSMSATKRTEKEVSVLRKDVSDTFKSAQARMLTV